jgi:hypothetical protein
LSPPHGWVWSKNVKPIAGTDSWQARHFGYMVSGRMKIVIDCWGDVSNFAKSS